MIDRLRQCLDYMFKYPSVDYYVGDNVHGNYGHRLWSCSCQVTDNLDEYIPTMAVSRCKRLLLLNLDDRERR